MCLDGVRGTVLSSLGKYPEAIESFVAARRYLDAIKLLLMDRNPDSTRQAYTYIAQELWKLMPFGFRAGNVRSDNITKLLTLSDGLERSFLQFNERDEVSVLDLLADNEGSVLRRLRCSTEYIQIIIQCSVDLARNSSTSAIFLRLSTVLSRSIMSVFLIPNQ